MDDNGNVCGINNPEKACIDIENRINDSISSRPEFELSVEKNTIRLYVKKGKFTPYFYKGKAYRRSGITTDE